MPFQTCRSFGLIAGHENETPRSRDWRQRFIKWKIPRSDRDKIDTPFGPRPMRSLRPSRWTTGFISSTTWRGIGFCRRIESSRHIALAVSNGRWITQNFDGFSRQPAGKIRPRMFVALAVLRSHSLPESHILWRGIAAHVSFPNRSAPSCGRCC